MLYYCAATRGSQPYSSTPSCSRVTRSGWGRAPGQCTGLSRCRSGSYRCRGRGRGHRRARRRSGTASRNRRFACGGLKTPRPWMQQRAAAGPASSSAASYEVTTTGVRERQRIGMPTAAEEPSSAVPAPRNHLIDGPGAAAKTQTTTEQVREAVKKSLELVREEPGLIVQPQTYNCKPQTQNPNPQTSNLQPQTPNLQPQTPNLQPQTSNPKPTTSNLMVEGHTDESRLPPRLFFCSQANFFVLPGFFGGGLPGSQEHPSSSRQRCSQLPAPRKLPACRSNSRLPGAPSWESKPLVKKYRG